MLCVTSESELFWNRRDWTVRNVYTIGIWIQLHFNKNSMKILIKNSTFDLQWIAWIIRTSTVIIKKNKNVHLNSESLSELKNSKNEVSLRLYLKKARFIEEMIYSSNLHHLPLKMFKVFVAIVDNFNKHFFFVRQS